MPLSAPFLLLLSFTHKFIGLKAITYDAGGRRIERTVSKAGTETVTRYVYDGENIIAELDKDGNPTEIFTNGPGIDEPLIMTRSDGANYYYHADALGSITALTDGKGQIAERMAYTAYGLPTRYNAKGEFIENSAIGNTRTYTAREQDDDTGLYYYRARYYDAETGRFTQEDPIGFSGKDVNLYAYVVGAPVGFRDPMGTFNLSTGGGVWGAPAKPGSNADLAALVSYEKAHGKIATIWHMYWASEFPNGTQVKDLSASFNSVIGPLNPDWMVKTAGASLLASVFSFPASAMSPEAHIAGYSYMAYGAGKLGWNSGWDIIAPFVNKKIEVPWAQMADPAYANVPRGATLWLTTNMTLEDIFSPQLHECK